MRVTPQALIKFVAPRAGKPMVFPYTWSSLWAHWNIPYEIRMNFTFRYTLIGMAIMFPFIYSIDSLVNSPAAKAAHKAAMKAEHEKEKVAHKWADISGRYASR